MSIILEKAMNKNWVIDVQDKSCPENVKEEIFDKMKEDWWLSNGSTVVVSIKKLKTYLSDDYDEDDPDFDSIYRFPIIIKFLEDQGLAEDEKVYVYLWW
jgi:hypothetical protein